MGIYLINHRVTDEDREILTLERTGLLILL